VAEIENVGFSTSFYFGSFDFVGSSTLFWIILRLGCPGLDFSWSYLRYTFYFSHSSSSFLFAFFLAFLDAVASSQSYCSVFFSFAFFLAILDARIISSSLDHLLYLMDPTTVPAKVLTDYPTVLVETDEETKVYRFVEFPQHFLSKTQLSQSVHRLFHPSKVSVPNLSYSFKAALLWFEGWFLIPACLCDP
jgi:hypothetical protein